MNYRFDDFELDTGLFELRRNGEPCPMEPQVFTVLAYLVEHHDRVVTKNELIDHVWHDRFISEAALTSRLMAARRVLTDNGQEQRYIKTVHGRGYRFVAPVHVQEGNTRADASVPVPSTATAPAALKATPPPVIFGREQELAHLRACYEQAAAGQRNVLFVTGEAGRGKSTLIDAFVASLAGDGVRIGIGHCAQQRGVGEPYMAAIEAMSSICESYGDAVTAIVARRAPAWLLQAPWLLGDEDLLRLRERALGNTSERMLREAAEAIEELSGQAPLVLVLEDLHWSDEATLDLIGWLARRREPARLLIIGSYRPADASEGGVAALQRELRVRGLCHELALPLLPAPALREYVESRFDGLDVADQLSAVLLRRTDGHPLFVRAVVDSWQAAGGITSSDGHWRVQEGLDSLSSAVPDTLRELIDDQFMGLAPDDRQLLEVAAIAGSPFSSAALAAVLEKPVDAVESRCEDLRRGGAMLATSNDTREWPDGTIAGSYEFVHSLYEEAIYGRMPPNRRSTLHQRMGEEIERAAGDDADAYAVELARHFGQTRDVERAVRYLRSAADQAMFRGAHREAAAHIQHALDLLMQWPNAAERLNLEAELQSLLGTAMIATKGFGSAEAEHAYGRALELTTSIEDGPRKSGVILGLTALLEYQGKHVAAEELLRQMDRMPEVGRELRIHYHALLSCSLFHQGGFRAAVDHGERGVSLQHPGESDAGLAFIGADAMLGCREWSSVSLWFLGFPDLAVTRIQSLLDEARREGRRYAYASGLSHCARVYHLRREPELALKAADEAALVAEEYGFAYHAAVSAIISGWARGVLASPEDTLADISRGLDAHLDTGAAMDRPYYLSLFADAQYRSGNVNGSLETLDDALALVTQAGAPFFFEAELLRMRGVFESEPTHAEAHVRDAIALSRKQEAKSLQLRAAVSLGKLPGIDRGAEARQMVAALLAEFTEGAETVDRREAAALLEGAVPTRERTNRPRRRRP